MKIWSLKKNTIYFLHTFWEMHIIIDNISIL